eukprot:SAG11_NODE_37516_length_256_cov_1.305732_1_plen_38_part_10
MLLIKIKFVFQYKLKKNKSPILEKKKMRSTRVPGRRVS